MIILRKFQNGSHHKMCVNYQHQEHEKKGAAKLDCPDCKLMRIGRTANQSSEGNYMQS